MANPSTPRPPALFLTFLAALLSLASLTVTKRAAAQEGIRLQVNWSTFAESYRALTADAARGSQSEAAARARIVTTEETPWLGSGMVVSLVARDWQGATRLAGGPLAVTDAIRTSRSSRMVVARIGLGGGRLVPFVHLGAGQWRDPNQHVLDSPLEVAGEAGAGFEAKLTRHLSCALEYDYTTLYRETGNALAPADNAYFAVARLEY
jgi:opacity protein-like surface antigen